MKKKVILVVDDQIEIIRFIAAHLTTESRYEVINANNGQIAYENIEWFKSY